MKLSTHDSAVRELSASELDQVSGGIKFNGLPIGLPPAAGPAPMQELPPDPAIFQNLHRLGF